MKRVLAVVFAVAISLLGAVPAFADEGGGHGQYLALGDSVAFGYTPPQVTPPANYQNASNFVGYPEFASRFLELKDSNASCSGEATGGFISRTSPDDNGCQTGYRLVYPLHVNYTSSQLDYAVNFLKTHHNTKLVSIDLGANDVFHLQYGICGGDPACIAAGLPGVLATNQVNLEFIFAAMRATGYHGTIVALTYYSLDYSAAGQASTMALNQPMINAAKKYHVRIASGFDAFKALALANGGTSCAAHLVIALPAGGCDVHPTPLGHLLLAAAVIRAAENRGSEGDSQN